MHYCQSESPGKIINQFLCFKNGRLRPSILSDLFKVTLVRKQQQVWESWKPVIFFHNSHCLNYELAAIERTRGKIVTDCYDLSKGQTGMFRTALEKRVMQSCFV